MMTTIGVIAMPAGFRYETVYRKGRPQHSKFDDFWRRHIPMDPAHRAKIFAPFDALAGFDEAVASKEVQYVGRKNIPPEELNAKLSAIAHRNLPVTISYFVPCIDPDNIAYMLGQGQYKTVTGVIERIDSLTETLRIADQEICMEDIGSIKEAWCSEVR